jgi:hypothetical protein
LALRHRGLVSSLGEVRLTPVYLEVGRKFFRADTQLGLIELLETKAVQPAPVPGGVNSASGGSGGKGASITLARVERGSTNSVTLAPKEGLEPPTRRLTAACSTD